MRQFLDYKKQYKISLALLVFILFFSFLYTSYISAQTKTKESLESEINSRNLDIANIETQIKSFQSEINNLGKQKNSLSKAIKELELSSKKLALNINLTQKQIQNAESKIEELSSEIGVKNQEIDLNTSALKKSFRSMNELDNTDFFVLLLNKNGLTEVWNDLDNIITIRENIREEVGNLKTIKGDLEDTQNTTVKVKENLEKLKRDLADEKKLIEQNKKDTEKLLKDTKNNESNYQKLLKEKQNLKIALEKELREYESQLKYILDPNSLPGANVLAWPLENVYITQLFGVTSASKRLYASGSHSGVDFRASVGTPVFSVAEGVVKAVGDTDETCRGASFGKWVFIEHNNGLASTYGHLSLIKATPGQKVSRGDLIAYSGNTGHTTGPHLHLTIYASQAAKVETKPSRACAGKTLTQPFAPVNAYLDPMYYLPKYKN